MSRKPANKPSSLSREEALERRLADLERMVRRIPVSSGPASVNATTLMVQQAAHGFIAKDVLRHNGTSWVKSQADTPANALAAGIVTAALSPDVFVMATGGYVAGLSGLSAGTIYYLSSATAGQMTSTAPANMVRVFFADTTTSGVMIPKQSVITASTSAPGSTAANDGDVWLKY